ncbi:MAG: hypothetical protein KKF30_07615 [Proteobacteria bacterium]|nr:hypothetical protein [Pseudomonadota bacterium]MBU4470264.1 hypothetical protein [Pseudomonadota bacterium]MCG2752678.1 hypothetical protein [Desulfobacteraceae bacterium]
MLKEFIDKILILGEPNIEEFYGLAYSDKTMTLIKEPQPGALHTGSLSSLVQYLNAKNLDGGSKKGCFLHITSPVSVSIRLPLNATQQRAELLEATHPKELRTQIFGDYYDIESFVIKMKTRFIETEASRSVVQLVGNIRDSKVAKVVDDGISQQVSTSMGIASISDVVIPNPIVLRPYRTFFEVDQPASPFLLRLKQGQNGQMPSCALFETDGGMWEKEAMESIREYLVKHLPDMVILA